ncbi:hypothetical protein CCICO_04450 [Corynebacterium ciconiae DSM 44920]|uniref:phage gene 29 protein family protein n=1 Tax=Corynebacterium ciconiae TaxID=227319 RepID=UPI0026497320|nr:DUF2744 domain-containing protein [Corynebacterium ciconiae]WKD60927.1 hypothetical protein CCICO_04450 [Corynebacterium ciconiae DSM 44920]
MIPIHQDKADMSDPEQHLGWALASIPPADFAEDQPSLVFPLLYIPWFSRFLYMCGFRHHAELQTVEQVVDESSPIRNAGVAWRPKDGSSEKSAGDVDLTWLSDEQAEALLDALQERLGR